MEIFYWILLIFGGFLLGSIMFCELIPKKLFKKSICEISVDNNPGAFNVFKHCGIKTGIPCMCLDILKGLIPVLIASCLMNVNSFAFSLVLVAPVLGHAVGLFNKFHGGKCVAVSFGVMFGLIPVTRIGIVTLAVLYILFSTLLRIRSASRRSLVVYALFAIMVCPVLCVLKLPFVSIGCGTVAFIPVFKFIFSKNGLVENNYYDSSLINDHINKGN